MEQDGPAAGQAGGGTGRRPENHVAASNVPVVWKQHPDAYLSWALALCNLTDGHLFVDLLPPTAQMFHLAPDETDAIGLQVEAAAREYLNTKHVVRVVCEREMTPDFFYSLLASNLHQLNPLQQVQQGPRDEGEARTQGKRRADPAASLQQGATAAPALGSAKAKLDRQRAGFGTGAKKGTAKKQGGGSNARQTPPQTTPDPFVLILQDLEELTHETQMALVEVLTKKTMPVSFASTHFGLGLSAASSVLVPGLFEIKAPHIVVGLSTSLQVPSFEYSANMPLQNGFARSNAAQGSQLAPVLLESFLLRIPIEMPHRAEIANLGYAPQGRAEGDEDDEPYAGGALNVTGHRDGASIEGSQGAPGLPGRQAAAPTNARRILLWPRAGSTAQVGHLMIPLPGEEAPKPFRLCKCDRGKIKEDIAKVRLSVEMETHLSNIITALRMHPFVLSGPSTRAYGLLQMCVRAEAWLVNSAYFAIPADVVEVVVEVLAHQIVLSFSAFPQAVNGMESAQASHPKDWHPLTAARYVVAQTVQYFVPPPR